MSPMSIQLSPGVVTKEFDLTLIIPQVATSGAAYVGGFGWGPCNEIKLISDKSRLIRNFGKPTDDTYLHWFSCANFLEYSRNLKVIRVVDETVAKNATTGATPTLILNEDDWNDNNSNGNSDLYGEFAGRFPGELGNSLGVYMADLPTFNAVAEVIIDEGGFGYADAADAAVTFSAPRDATGVTETGTAVVDANGQVTSVTIDGVGTKYKFPPSITFASATGVDLAATIEVTAGDIDGLTITEPGRGFIVGDIVDLTLTSGTGQVLTVSDVDSEGGVVAVVITGTSDGSYVDAETANTTPSAGLVTATGSTDLWKYRDQFLAAPGTSDYVANKGGSNDEIHIVVVDETGEVTGEAGNIIERYAFVSKAKDALYDDGTSSYYPTVLRDASAYVFWLDHPTDGTNWGSLALNIDFDVLSAVYEEVMTGGVDSNDVSNNELLLGWDQFRNPENADVGILISGAADRVLQQYLIQNIAEYRKDCVAVISPEMTDVVRNPTDEVADTVTLRDVLTSSSYGILDGNWKYQFDMYNDTFRWIPCNPDVAGLLARTDEDRDPWWSPAGFNRGQIKNCVKLAWNPDMTDRDELYQNGINPIVTFAGEGTIFYGDKTMLTKPSAFDRINVRRLFIVLEKAIAKAAKYGLFEFNDAATRMKFVQMVEPYLRNIQGRRGITDFKVVCDETNNTPFVIDSNGFVADCYIKPARSINFITLSFIATPTGVDFTEAQSMMANV